ncbi:hypothetical protein ACHWQZ_G012592 [Mnemiopsis leidyi]
MEYQPSYMMCTEPSAHPQHNTPVNNQCTPLGVELARNEDLKKAPSPLETTVWSTCILYTHSKAKIKPLDKLPDKVVVLCGTEQGHPMSPELFKCFVHQLSEDLNSLKDVEVPVLDAVEVGKSTSNTAVWGDTGRYPLAVELLSQTFSYLQRLEEMDQQNCSTLVRHAYVEQRELELTWFSRLKSVRNIAAADQSLKGKNLAFNCSPQAIRERSRELFIAQWNMERATNKKLGFYISVKTNFGLEPYLKSDIPHQHLKRFAEFRMSSHRYNIETGRYGLSKEDIFQRICYQCSTNDKQVLENLKEPPFFCPIIEDEYDVLRTCTLYEDLRHKR